MIVDDDIGARVRSFRKLRRMPLRALAEAAGLSPSFVSQFENGLTNASIGSLRRLADSLGVSLADLVDSDTRPANTVLRREDRPTLPSSDGARKFVITQPPLRHVEVYVSEFAPGGSTGSEQYAHGEAQEVLLVLRGEVTLHLDDQELRLHPGDSIEYLSSTPHRVVNLGDTEAEVLWVTSPPTPEHAPVTTPVAPTR